MPSFIATDGNLISKQNSEYFIQVQAYKNSLKTLEKQKRVLQKNQLTLEDKIRVLSIELENTTNLLKHSERINATAETAKKELQTELDNHLVQIEKWETSSKNLFRLVDSSMSVRTKVGLGFTNYIGENELGWDDSAFSVFTTNSEEVEGRPHFNRFAKTDSMKAVPPPLSGDYTPLSDHTDLDESQMSYGTKSSTSGDSNSVSNDFVSCDNSDKSTEVNSNDFASSDSSVKSSEPKSNDSISCASTSSVSTSESEAEIESNVGTPIQEPIIVQDLPSFSCNSSDKNENSSRTSCNKNGYFNKKAGHFRKNASSVSKLCFVCGSSTHLIKDCDFYEKQMANKTVGNGVGPVHSRNNVNHQNQFVPQAVLLRTGKVNIPPARPQPVPTGKPKVPAPVPTGRQNRPFPVPTDRGYSPSVTSGWWKSTARPMPHLNRPTSSYFQTYTPYVPQMYYNHMKYGGVRWATAVKPSAGCSWKTHRKGLYWVPKNNSGSHTSSWTTFSDPQGRPKKSSSDAEDEGIFDSGCSRSMTGNMERLDDFQEFQGGKVTFGGGEGKNPVFHQRTKHIEIRHHFIRDANEKKLIQVLKIHTDDNVADLLTKAFDGPSINSQLRSTPSTNSSHISKSSIAATKITGEHNKVGYLQKPTGSDDYHQILDFLRASHIRSPELGPPAILATIDETPYTITEDSVRSQLQLADDGGIDDLPIAEIYSGMDNLGYVTKGKLTFYKNKFSPQWRFLVHTILHCLSTKSGSWDQFGSSLVVALICLSDGRKFNWSSYIFKGMHGQSSDPNIASFSRVHETDDDPFTSTKVEDKPLGGSFHASPPRSTQAPLAGHTSGGAEDLITLTVVSFVVSTLMQNVNHWKMCQGHQGSCLNVAGKLVKKVKAMEVKLKTKKRKVVVSDSDQEEGGEQDVDLDALLALANAAVIVDSNIPPGGASSSHIPTDVPIGVAPAGVSNKGKTLMVEEDITLKERTLKQMEDDRLGEEAAKRLHDEEQAQVDRQRAELKRRRQQEVEANASLSKTLLGDDVTEDNFPVRMAALIKRKKQALVEELAKERIERLMTHVQQRTYMRQFVKNQSSALYSTGWTKAKVESFTDAKLKEEFEKIQKAPANTQVQAFSRTLKRTGPELEEPSSKQQKSTEAPISSVPDVPQPPVVSSPKSSGTRRKSLGRNRLTKPKSILKELDLDADDKTFIKVVSDEDSTDEAPILWSALAGWEVISTPLGEINALYRSDQSTKHFTTLREILHMVDRQDLLKLYGMVVKYYENHLVAGAGLMLWGDLQVLIDSQEGGKGSFVWNHQHLWQLRSWRLYTLSNVHVLETVSGEVLYMFADVSYPLSVKIMERMLKHKLEIDKDVVGNDMTTAEQLIRFIKNQIAAAQVSPV
ncbi:ribonuclease H-like domain-containing protein [Tanacetum coccineum]|uniref:Ribonuclease H-like domain-containing protein n=1 Tax=Tanacetum coccineum TaxID=301880 RepID=A0ABQ5BUQ2_9ASTR